MACSTVSENRYHRGKTGTSDGSGQKAQLSHASLTAPISGSGRRELESLRQNDRDDGWQEPAGVLRQAYILTETGRADDALSLLNRMLYGKEAVSPAVESYARFVRGLALEKLGQHEQALIETQRAYDLAIDDSLRRALGPRQEPAVAAEARSPRYAMPSPLPRTAWNAQGLRRGATIRKMGQVTRLTVHHSATMARSTGKRHARTAILGIQRYHQGPEKRWADIGYHYLIDPAGRIWTGRSLAYQGAHAGNPQKNRGNIGICMLGNFVPSGQRPTQVQTQALENLIAGLCSRFDIPPSQILTHGELKTTQCPGPYLSNTVKRLRSQMAAPVPPGK